MGFVSATVFSLRISEIQDKKKDNKDAGNLFALTLIKKD